MTDWQPTLRGERVALRPIRADGSSSDLDAMHAAASDPEVWAQHSERNRHERAVFERFGRVIPEMVVYDQEGAIFSVRYEMLNILLLQEIQALKENAERMDKEIKELRNLIPPA